MGRKRRKNRDLPERVYKKHGAYYYVTPENQWIRLGKTKAEMYKTLAELEIQPSDSFTVENLWKDFLQDRVVSLSPATVRGYEKSADVFLKTFGHMYPEEVMSKDIARYLLVRGRKAKTSANREVAVMSSMFTYAVALGISERNPCLRVARHKIGPRERYVEDWELEAFSSISGELLNCYVDLKYLTGLRETDLLQLTFANEKDEGLYVRPSKTRNSTGEPRLYVWVPELREVVDRIHALPRPKFATHFFCKPDGSPFITTDLKTQAFGYIWGKAMRKALKETNLKERFQEKDLRAKAATDADDEGQDATELLGHGDRRTTKIYLRGKKVKKVTPYVPSKDKSSGSKDEEKA
ncbi:MAG: tyrosine-type recombinase/integrase [Candidatus Sedimenticola sp. 6PFRAG5]